jgi:diadenosine tetraphosphate (Ap4A) HIT family hydrolase
MATGCIFCEKEGGQRLWRDARCRVVLTDEPFAGFCRVIWNAHVREMTDLDSADRAHALRRVRRRSGAPGAAAPPGEPRGAQRDPHLHWHVIPRFTDDSHFPQPVWGARQRAAAPKALPDEFAPALARDLAAALGAGDAH